MEIHFDVYIKQEDEDRTMKQIVHTVLTEDDLCELVRQRFQNGDESIPINYTAELCLFEVSIGKTIID